jgi:DnaA family protein
MKQLALPVQLRGAAVFASFVSGPNQELIAALRQGGKDPVWIWGAHGAGKTHLLQAACAEARDRAAYLPLERGRGLDPAALPGFESLQLVCLDDLDAVVGADEWERALFRFYNAAAEQGTRLVFAAVAAPRALPWGLEDWRSRAAACVVYHLQELDDAGRIAALTLRAGQRGIVLPTETAEYLLHRMPRDLPSLLALLDELDTESLAAQRRLTIPFIRAALERAAKTRP